MPIALGLDAALEVKNLNFGREWGSRIEADGNDQLRFKFLVRNSRPKPSPQMITRIYVSPSDSELRTIAFSFGDSEYGPFIPGPRIQVVPQSNGLYTFHNEELKVGYPPSTATRLRSLGGFMVKRGQEWATGYEWVIPSIPANRTLSIGFFGSFWTPETSQLSGGPVVRMKNLTEGQDEYATTVSVRPGDVIAIGGMLDNGGFRETRVLSRFALSPRHAGRFFRIRLYASEVFGRNRELGYGTVNSAEGRPMALRVVPGTTELVGPKTDCSEETRAPLPDGIAQGGVDVGSIGGFRPRDPCHGTEFTRIVTFKARALPETLQYVSPDK